LERREGVIASGEEALVFKFQEISQMNEGKVSRTKSPREEVGGRNERQGPLIRGS